MKRAGTKPEMEIYDAGGLANMNFLNKQEGVFTQPLNFQFVFGISPEFIKKFKPDQEGYYSFATELRKNISDPTKQTFNMYPQGGFGGPPMPPGPFKREDASEEEDLVDEFPLLFSDSLI